MLARIDNRDELGSVPAEIFQRTLSTRFLTIQTSLIVIQEEAHHSLSPSGTKQDIAHSVGQPLDIAQVIEPPVNYKAVVGHDQHCRDRFMIETASVA
jgi:hypothetical protein